MRKNTFTLIVFLLLGLLVGSIAGQLLSTVPWLSFLATGTQVEWHPRADLNFLQYDVLIRIKLNLAGILGLVGAVWIYRKL